MDVEMGGGDGVVFCVCVCVCRRSWSLTRVAALRDFLWHRQVFEPSVTPSAGSVAYNPRTKKTPPNWPATHLGGRADAELLQRPALIAGITFEPLHVGRTLQFTSSSTVELFRSSVHIPFFFTFLRKSNAISQHPGVNLRAAEVYNQANSPIVTHLQSGVLRPFLVRLTSCKYVT